MKVIGLYFVLLIVTLGFNACSGCSNSAPQRTEADAARKANPDPKDSTMYVVLDAIKGDSMYVSNMQTQRKLVYSTTLLKKTQQSFGTMKPKENLAIMVELNSKNIKSAINITELQGLWLLSDMSGNGMRLDEDGAASNVGDLNGITLRSWRVMNGKLIISCIKSDGSDYHEKEHKVDIHFLSPSKLTFGYNGVQYDFGRE